MAPTASSSEQRITWDSGSAYDFFASLIVLHQPDSFGLRRAWAAGVRNRVAPEVRESLRYIAQIVSIPSHLLLAMKEPKDAASVLDQVCRLDADEVVAALADPAVVRTEVLANAKRTGRYLDTHVEELIEYSKTACVAPLSRSEAALHFDMFVRAEQYGREIQQALTEYYDRFFREEEERTKPVVTSALRRAQNAAKRQPVVDLVEELSGGLRMEELYTSSRVILVPAFWAGPLVFYGIVDDDVPIVIFSARPRSVSLVPGQLVPDSLHLALQALADQSRLRILKLVAAGPLTQAEIARELRLRPPTITHHLRILRRANLIRLTESRTGAKRYSVRSTELKSLPERLFGFVGM